MPTKKFGELNPGDTLYLVDDQMERVYERKVSSVCKSIGNYLSIALDGHGETAFNGFPADGDHFGNYYTCVEAYRDFYVRKHRIRLAHLIEEKGKLELSIQEESQTISELMGNCEWPYETSCM